MNTKELLPHIITHREINIEEPSKRRRPRKYATAKDKETPDI
jgi:hypothetical protein